jgi:hypothetical protein
MEGYRVNRDLPAERGMVYPVNAGLIPRGICNGLHEDACP